MQDSTNRQFSFRFLKLNLRLVATPITIVISPCGPANRQKLSWASHPLASSSEEPASAGLAGLPLISKMSGFWPALCPGLFTPKRAGFDPQFDLAVERGAFSDYLSRHRLQRRDA
jgi:hypothetical protein